jgi:hypothetical protein
VAVEFGLYPVAGSASLTLIAFPALVLVAVLGLRFAYYAARNSRATDLAAEGSLWTHLQYAGLLAALYGAFGVLEIVSTIRAAYKSAFMLATVLLFAFAVRELYRMSGGPAPSRFEQVVRVAFVLAIAGHALAGQVLQEPRILAGAEGLVALAVFSYGATFYDRQTGNTQLRGTMLDSLLRHLLPVLAFGALVNVTALAQAVGVDPAVVPHIQVVFLLLTAGTLMTATIKLRQNLAGL